MTQKAIILYFIRFHPSFVEIKTSFERILFPSSQVRSRGILTVLCLYLPISTP